MVNANSVRRKEGYQRRTVGVAPPGSAGTAADGVRASPWSPGGGGGGGSGGGAGNRPTFVRSGGTPRTQQPGGGGVGGGARPSFRSPSGSPMFDRSMNRGSARTSPADGGDSAGDKQSGYMRRRGAMPNRGGGDLGSAAAPTAYERRQQFLARAEEMAKLTAGEKEAVDFINDVELKGGMDVTYTAFEGGGNPNKSKMSVNYGIARQRKARAARLAEFGEPDVALDAGVKVLNSLGMEKEDADDVKKMFNMIRVHNRSYKSDTEAAKIALKVKELEKLYADDILYSEAMGEDEYQN